MLAENEELERRRHYLSDAMGGLNDREKRIFEARRLSEDPLTLETLSAGVRCEPGTHPAD